MRTGIAPAKSRPQDSVSRTIAMHLDTGHLPGGRKVTKNVATQNGESNGTQTGTTLLRLTASPVRGLARR